MIFFIGIDPGLNGGIAKVPGQYDKKFGIIKDIQLFKTPVIGGRDYDIQAMKDILMPPMAIVSASIDRKKVAPLIIHDLFVVIEQQIAMPGQGLSSTLQTGKGFGIWLGLIAGLQIPHQVVMARAWQTRMFTGVSGKLEPKQKSEIVAKRLFPSADFRKSTRATKADDGLTDAACIAEYARRIRSGNSMPLPFTNKKHEFIPENPDICINCGSFQPDSNNCTS